jgi:uncharacterized protein (DUF2267 family)
MKSFDSFCKFNLENWFIQPGRAQYTLFVLSTCLTHFEDSSIREYIDILLKILDGNTSVDMKTLSCLVIENLFAGKHINNQYTKELINRLMEAADKIFLDQQHPNELTSMVQCLVQVYLNFNTGSPSLAKDLLPKVFDLCAELLALDPAEMTVFDTNTVALIKERTTKSLELLLLLSCDEYLYPTDDALSFLGALTIQDNIADEIRQNEGLGRQGNLTPREKLIITFKNLLSPRFASSQSLILTLIDSFCTKLHQLGLSQQASPTADLLELLQAIKSTLGFNPITEPCMGNIVARVNMKTLLDTFPLRVLEIDMLAPAYDTDSNAFLLSLLALYKPRSRFPIFYECLFPQLQQISQRLKQQAMFKESQHQDALLYNRYSNLENQYLSILKKSTVFPSDNKEQFPEYLEALLTCMLDLDEKEVEKMSYFGEPLKFLLVAAISEKDTDRELYAKILGIVRDKSLLSKLCKLSNKLDEKVTFLSDCIKILVIMLDRNVAAGIVSKNISRLAGYFNTLTDCRGNVFERNLRDVDTVCQMVSVLKEIHSLELYHEVLKFIDILFAVENEKVWKKATTLTQALIANSHYSYCPAVFEKISMFFDRRMKAIKEKKEKNADKKQSEMAEERVQSRKVKQRLQGIVLKVAKEFIKSYFFVRIEDVAQKNVEKLQKIGDELNLFADSYLPVAIICIKNKSAKTRMSARDFLLRLTEAFTKITGDNTTLLSTVLAGLAGKTSLMKSATILAVTMLVETLHSQLESEYIDKVAEVVLMVLKDQNKEIFHAALVFLRLYVKLIDAKQLKAQIPYFFQAIYEFDGQSAKSSTKEMTMFLERVIKKVGEDEVSKSLPESERNVIRYIRRQEKRQSRLKAKKRVAEYIDRVKMRNPVDQIDVANLDAEPGEKLSKKNQKKLAEQKETQGGMNMELGGGKKQGEDLLMKFDAANESFHFTKHQIFQIKANDKNNKEKLDVEDSQHRGDVYFDEQTNKLVVKEKEKKTAGFKRKPDALDGVGSDDEEEDEKTTASGKGNKGDGHQGGKKAMQEETLAARMLKKANMLKKNDNVHNIRESGEMYRAKGNTRGDVLIPGKAAPHAFVQLNPMVNIVLMKGFTEEEQRKGL